MVWMRIKGTRHDLPPAMVNDAGCSSGQKYNFNDINNL